MNEDLKAKMREALEAKKGRKRRGSDDSPSHEKVHGPEVTGTAAPPMHRRKTAGGGS